MKTIVFIEKNAVTHKCRDVSVELAAKAHALMAPFQGETVGVFVGNELPSDTEILFQYGLNRFIYTTRSEYGNLHSIAYKNVIVQMIKKEKPDIVLFGATNMGRDIAPLISSSIVTGLTADCTQLYIDDYKENGKILYQVRPAFGGNILATIITPEHRPAMATVREGVMRLPEKRTANPVKTEAFDASFDEKWIINEFLNIVPKERKVNFKSSDIIVAGGAGIGSKENFKLLFDLADALGGEVGASRAAVDYGFVDKARQIGQTGAVVRPKLYISCGISGSIQHRAGMSEANKIIAINTDKDAPIFGIAHLGIVEDFKSVIPMMIKYLKEEGSC